MENGLYNITPKEFRILDRQEYGNNVQYTLEAVNRPECCPVCRSVRYIGKGLNPRKARDLSEFGKLVGLVVKTHRYSCKDCGNTWSDVFETLPPNAKMTSRLRNYICERAMYMPFSDIKRDLDISVPTIKKIFHEHVIELDSMHRMIAPEVLGMDETMLQGKYRGMYVDIKGGRIIDMTSDRKKQTVIDWLDKLPQKERIQCVTIDMWGDYKDAVKEVLPNIPIVIDKFHIFEHVYDAFNTIRKRLSEELPLKEKAFVKSNWRLLSHNASTLDYESQVRLRELLNKCPVLQAPHTIKEDFSYIYTASTRKEAEILYKKWSERASEYKEFSDISEMVQRWHEYIFSYFNHPYTNATTEALNRLAKEISAKGRGYSYDVLKAKIIYGTAAAKPAKYEYRPVYNTSHNMVIGLMTPEQINHRMRTSHIEKYDKVLVAVPGTEIEELIQIIGSINKEDYNEYRYI